MEKSTLYTENGIKELDYDVAIHIQSLNDEIQKLRKERNLLKLKIFKLEFKLNRGWLYQLFCS